MAGTMLEQVIEQERILVLPAFDEAIAFEIGTAMHTEALAKSLPIVIDIRTFDRPLFYAALPGSSGSNPNWARRKINVVTRFLKSSYRLVLEKNREDRTFPPGEGLAIADYVLAGGGFPVRVANAGVVGAIAVSGLPEQEDHMLVVEALCDRIGISRESMALPTAVR